MDHCQVQCERLATTRRSHEGLEGLQNRQRGYLLASVALHVVRQSGVVDVFGALHERSGDGREHAAEQRLLPSRNTPEPPLTTISEPQSNGSHLFNNDLKNTNE
jgi:hypothetical protein